MYVDGKTVVVTGAGSGIGAATAMEFAKSGARVILADLNTESGEAEAGKVRSAGYDALFLPVDVTDGDSVTLFAAKAQEWSEVDVLVNGAGWGKIQLFMENDCDFWRKVIAVNFEGVVRLTRAFLPKMIERKLGRVVNISSDAGRVGSTGETVYAGAKGGVIAFSKSLAREMARYGITVNCVCPGPTNTPLLRAVPEEHRNAFRRAIPMRRFAEPEEIAAAVLYFAGHTAAYVTGQVLSVSGGLTMVD